MSSMELFAFAGIIAYTVFCLYIGLGKGYEKKVVSSASGYFLGGGTAKFVLFFTTVATWFSTGIYQGVVGSVYKNGIGWIGISTWQLVVVMLMGVLGPRFWRLSKEKGYITPADLVSDYYQSKYFKQILGFGMLVFCIPSMIAQITGVGWAISGITNGIVDFKIGVLYAAVIVGLYVFFGGFRSQAWVDTAQGLLFVVILWGCVFFLSREVGGFTTVFNRLTETAPEVFFYKTDPGEYWTWRKYLSFFVLQGCGGFFAPYVWQRAYAAKSGSDLRKISGYMAVFFCIGVVFPVIFMGLGMHTVMPALSNPENGLVLFAAKYAPVWGVFVTIGILAAGMSTISSILVTASSIVAIDFIKARKPHLDTHEIRNYGRMGVLGILAVSVFLAFMNFHTIEILINLTLAGFTQVLIPVLGIFVFKRVSKEGAVAGYITGLLVTFVGTIILENPLGFMGGLWGLVFNAIVCILVSMMTKPVIKDQQKNFLSPLYTVRNTIMENAAVKNVMEE